MKLVRVWFEKTGVAKYVSHLDLNRCMIRALRRAQLPIWYTEGFNPHPFTTFALPLSLGQEGLRETMDMKLLEDVPFEDIKNRLNAVLPGGIRVADIKEAVMKPGVIAFARYSLLIRADGVIGETLREQIGEVLSRPELLVARRTKSGVKEIDLSPFLSHYTVNADENGVQIDIVLPAGSTQNINPTVVFDALCKHLPYALHIKIQRLDAYNKDMRPFA